MLLLYGLLLKLRIKASPKYKVNSLYYGILKALERYYIKLFYKKKERNNKIIT